MQPKLLGELVLPRGFGPPAYEIFTDALEFLVAGDHIQSPPREDVNMRVAIRSKHSNSAVLLH